MEKTEKRSFIEISMNNSWGGNPSPVCGMEIIVLFYWKSQFRQKGNHFVFKTL